MDTLDFAPPSLPDISDHLADFRIEITRRAALAVMLVASVAAWMVMSFNPFPLGGFVILLLVIILAALIRQQVEAHPRPARYLFFAGLVTAAVGLMLSEPAPWLPFLALPVIFLGSILVSRGEFISGGVVLVVTAGLAWSGWRDYPLPAFAIALVLTLSVAWVVIFMSNTSLSWYQVMLEQSNHLLQETRVHRGELSKALKNLKLANDLQRRTEQELILARKGAEEARIMKEKFAAKVSHELRTPLALIAGFSEVMYSSPEIYGDVTWTPTMRRDISQMYHNSHHLLAMIDDILNLSRFEMTGFTISLEEVNLNDLLSETAAIAADLFRSPQVRFYSDYAPGLPALRIDRTRIRQVILNLVNNARRFTETGEVCLSAWVTEQEVRIRVRDTGPGIPADKLNLIFQEFYQVEDSLLRNKGGTGLGLAICKHFVDTHGGRIWAESVLGQGSEFIFALPLTGVLAATGLAANVPLLPADLTRILVLGADDHVLAMLRSVMSGYELRVVESPGQLRSAVALLHPRAIIWNLLPGEEVEIGTSLHNLAVPVVRCSLPSTIWLVKKLGIQACLAKPVTPTMLARELDRLPAVRRVLLVDDDPDFIQLLQRILQTLQRDFEVITAADGREGLAAAAELHPELILLDLTMPDVDGFGVIAELKKDPVLAQVPVILLTATLVPERLVSFSANRIVVERLAEMSTKEILNLVKSSLDVLETHYEESTDEVISQITQNSRSE